MMTKIIQIDDSFYQHQRLGRKVLKALIVLARQKGWEQLKVQEIYTFNRISRRCFESLGFVERGATEKGVSFVLTLGE